MKLYIMRHSETDWNHQHRIQGQTDVHLNLNGMKIAAMAGDGMKDIPIDVCYSSPLMRAQETAALVVARNPHFVESGSRIILDDRLLEISFGVWEGRDGSDSAMGIDREQFREFFTNLSSDFCPEGAERPMHVIERSSRFLDELISREDLKDRNVLILSHGFTIRCMLSRFHEDLEQYFRKSDVLYNCQVALAETDETGKLVLKETGKLYYDAAHAKNYYR